MRRRNRLKSQECGDFLVMYSLHGQQAKSQSALRFSLTDSNFVVPVVVSTVTDRLQKLIGSVRIVHPGMAERSMRLPLLSTL